MRLSDVFDLLLMVFAVLGGMLVGAWLLRDVLWPAGIYVGAIAVVAIAVAKNSLEFRERMRDLRGKLGKNSP